MKRESEKSGFLLLDKPGGLTSRKVLDLMIRAGRYRGKAGHAGTLDPLATGLLILCFGRATRLAQYLIEEDKKYTTTLFLGEDTDTCDREGELLSRAPEGAVEVLTETGIQAVLDRYTGVFQQVPPVFSARKVKGKRSYELARMGMDVDLQPSRVEVKDMRLLSWDPPFLRLSILCSTGTYVRAIARDVGRDLGVGGHVHSLERNAVGSLTVEEAIPLDEAMRRAEEEGMGEMFLPIELPLRNWSKVRIDDSSKHRLVHGSKVVVGDDFFDGVQGQGSFPCRVGIWEADGTFLGVGRIEPAGARSYVLYPEKVITAGFSV